MLFESKSGKVSFSGDIFANGHVEVSGELGGPDKLPQPQAVWIPIWAILEFAAVVFKERRARRLQAADPELVIRALCGTQWPADPGVGL